MTMLQKRNIITLFIKSLAFLVPLLFLSAIVPYALIHSPMRYFDEEYAWYKQNEDYANGHTDYCRVLIMGDSVSKAGWLPSELSSDTYNYSMGGVTPIEEYYCLRDYLRNNEPPEYLIYSQNISHFTKAEKFWSRCVYFHRIGPRDVYEVYSRQKEIGRNDILFQDNDLLDILLYYTYSPVYYSSAYLKGTFFSREQVNSERYDEVAANGGRAQFGDGSNIQLSSLAGYTSFACNDLIDAYFRMIIDLCDEYGIKFIFQSVPVTDMTYEALNADMIREYDEYMKKLQTDYPDATISGGVFSYDVRFFSDSNHLSLQGAVKYSQEMREKYSSVFEGSL